MRPLTLATTLTDLAAAQGWPLTGAAFVYHRVGGMFGFDRLRAAAGSRTAGDPFERLAVRRLIEDMLTEQAAVASAVMTCRPGVRAGGCPSAPVPRSPPGPPHADPVKAAKRTVDDIEKAAGGITFAKLTLANAALRELAEA